MTFWYGVPDDDDRFTYPNCPNWSVRGVYGFPSRGFKVAPSFDSVPFDPDTDERVVTPEEIRRTRDFVSKSFPGLAEQPILESRVCQYETSRRCSRWWAAGRARRRKKPTPIGGSARFPKPAA